LFVICLLGFGIFYIRRLNRNLGVLFDFFIYLYNTTLVHVQSTIDVNNLTGNKAG
jgi:hypothetical protein